MISMSLVNIHHIIQIQNKRKTKKIFFLVIKTLRISSLNNFHILHRAVSVMLTMFYITSLICIYLISFYIMTIFEKDIFLSHVSTYCSLSILNICIYIIYLITKLFVVLVSLILIEHFADSSSCVL